MPRQENYSVETPKIMEQDDFTALQAIDVFPVWASKSPSGSLDVFITVEAV